MAVPSRLQEAIGDLAAALNVLADRGPADVSDSIAAANHAAELIDNRPLSTEGYLAFIGSLTRLGAADLYRAVDLDRWSFWIIEDGTSKTPDWEYRSGKWYSPYGIENRRTFRVIESK